jgi:hypothetical protein
MLGQPVAECFGDGFGFGMDLGLRVIDFCFSTLPATSVERNRRVWVRPHRKTIFPVFLTREVLRQAEPNEGKRTSIHLGRY